MAEDRNGKDAVTLVAAAFFVSFSHKNLLPVSCFLLVTYRCPILQFLPLFMTAQSIFPFSLLGMKKVPQSLKITVLSSLSVFSTHKVYLEFASVCCFLYGNCNAQFYATYSHFCYLHVAYPANFRTCERFPRLIYASDPSYT